MDYFIKSRVSNVHDVFCKKLRLSTLPCVWPAGPPLLKWCAVGLDMTRLTPPSLDQRQRTRRWRLHGNGVDRWKASQQTKCSFLVSETITMAYYPEFGPLWTQMWKEMVSWRKLAVDPSKKYEVQQIIHFIAYGVFDDKLTNVHPVKQTILRYGHIEDMEDCLGEHHGDVAAIIMECIHGHLP